MKDGNVTWGPDDVSLISGGKGGTFSADVESATPGVAMLSFSSRTWDRALDQEAIDVSYGSLKLRGVPGKFKVPYNVNARLLASARYFQEDVSVYRIPVSCNVMVLTRIQLLPQMSTSAQPSKFRRH